MAGLVAALLLAGKGVAVTVLERAATPGGKLREVVPRHRPVDSGPTVLTMRRVFERIFDEAGLSLADHVTLSPSPILARHSWRGDERLDLFADRDRSAEAIGDFAGASEARGYLAFCRDSRAMFETLESAFIDTPRPSLPGLIAHHGILGAPRLLGIRPFATMWSALGGYFRDARLRQLFGRYATYCGSSPFLAPATLMLVAHVEQAGVWLVQGGMHRLAQALADAASAKGARLRYGTHVARIRIESGRVAGVALAGGEVLDADAVIHCGDVAALASGMLGADAARAASPASRTGRSLSAVTFSLDAPTDGFPLARHNIFFSRDYEAEFAEISRRGELPREPTIYVCAQDRCEAQFAPAGRERLFCLVNAPARGDTEPFTQEEIARCRERTFTLLGRHGLRIETRDAPIVTTDPTAFDSLYPGTGGALYGPASHGWRASFARRGVRTKLEGLYLAGGSVHPGPGLPMAATSGRWAAATLLCDFASTGMSRRTAISGGISTPSAMTEPTG